MLILYLLAEYYNILKIMMKIYIVYILFFSNIKRTYNEWLYFSCSYYFHKNEISIKVCLLIYID